jgi:serine/threonine protein kinase
MCNATSNSQELTFAKTEMEIHSALEHETIVKVLECGENGKL